MTVALLVRESRRPAGMELLRECPGEHGNEDAQDMETNPCYVLGRAKDSPQRQHLVRYHHSWSEQANLASLGEICAVFRRDGFWPDGWELMKPSTLLNYRTA